MATWDKNTPTGSTLGTEIPAYIREMKDYLEDALSREHNFPDSGAHKKDVMEVVQIVENATDLDLVEGGLGFVTSTSSLYTKTDSGLVDINVTFSHSHPTPLSKGVDYIANVTTSGTVSGAKLTVSSASGSTSYWIATTEDSCSATVSEAYVPMMADESWRPKHLKAILCEYEGGS